MKTFHYFLGINLLKTILGPESLTKIFLKAGEIFFLPN